MSPAVQRAVEIIEAEAAKLEHEAAILRAVAGRYRLAEVNPPAQPAPGEYTALGIVGGAAKLLTAAEEGLTSREIADALRAGGLRSSSKNLTATVFASLTNAPKKFRKSSVEGLVKWFSIGSEDSGQAS